MGIGRGRWWGYRFFDGVSGNGEVVYRSSGIFGAMMGIYDPWWISTQLRSIWRGCICLGEVGRDINGCIIWGSSYSAQRDAGYKIDSFCWEY